MDYEFLGLSIILIFTGITLILKNKFWKLDDKDLKKITEIQLFGSGVASLLIGVVVFIKLILTNNFN